MTAPKIKIGFAGTPELAFYHYQELAQDNELEIKYVLTQPISRSGRGLTNQRYSLQNLSKEIPTFAPTDLNEKGFAEDLVRHQIDLLVVVAYGQILPEWILNYPRFGCMNVHFSLLPLYRGASPIQRSIENGDCESGVSFMKLNEEMDAGPIYFQSKTTIKGLDFYEVEEKLVNLSLKNLNGVIKKIVSTDLKANDQDHTLATTAKKILKDEGQINWADNFEVILNKFRAFKNWPEAFFVCKNQKIKIHNMIIDAEKTGPAGTVAHIDKDSIGIFCNNGIILITDLQFPGKKIISARDFFNSKRDIISVGDSLN
tara:strand:+ start:10923 stop:11864 length:942 start_codon:yes stop_codon:yes gene_type:complete